MEISEIFNEYKSAFIDVANDIEIDVPFPSHKDVFVTTIVMTKHFGVSITRLCFILYEITIYITISVYKNQKFSRNLISKR